MEEVSFYTEQCDKTMTHMQQWYRDRLLFKTGLREIACQVDEKKEDSEGSGVSSGDENADVDVDHKSSEFELFLQKRFEEGSISGRYMAMYLRTVAYKVRCECEHVRCMVLEYLGAVYNEPAHSGA
ncbi:unnamed protein product [Cylicocyclus nassatus]|uniref:Uncharacterized protein n=1 Tax=Cylicocyclus nassatus TaxID=53992 RepID=A0AA36GT83_CYLNA|nr:unnamed protein product [Cylicocyclus nassatus]